MALPKAAVELQQRKILGLWESGSCHSPYGTVIAGICVWDCQCRDLLMELPMQGFTDGIANAGICVWDCHCRDLPYGTAIAGICLMAAGREAYLKN